MKSVGFLLLLFLHVSCSGGSSDGKITSGLSVSQKEVQKLIKNDIAHLQNSQYGISESDISLILKENLIDQTELNSLNVIK